MRSSRASTQRLSSAGSSTRAFLATLLDDCPICLNEMQQTDCDHLLQCRHHCGFNMCRHRIESLLASSKDDYQEASDGNRHVKVYLRCPKCRSDLTHTIRDTLLLRKVDEIIHATTDRSEWSSSQLRLENALHTPSVNQAIRQARKLEADYMGQDVFESSFSIPECDEWGFEADCEKGVHDSFRMPPPPEPLPREEAVRVDPTLFDGLDFALTEDQRLEVTELMTSGDPTHLMEASEILHTVAQRLANPRQARANPQQHQQLPVTQRNKEMQLRKSLIRRSSVFQLIAEAEAAHEQAQNKEEKKINDACSVLNKNLHSRAAHRNLEQELRLQANFQKQFPIPVRMPKTIEVNMELPFDMEFVDYTWGGTVLDAYSKISIGFRNKVTQSRPRNVNVAKILGTSGVSSQSSSAAMGCAAGFCITEQFDVDDSYIALPGEARVLISHTGRSGKQGAVRGDVLTHVSGESVAGKTVSHVLLLLHRKMGEKIIVLTLNAELSVAEALRRRAAAIAAI